MRLIEAKREAILAPLQAVSGVVARNATLPILSNVLVRKTGSSVTFVGSDIDMQIEATAQVGAGDGAESVTINAKKLTDIVRALPSESNVIVDIAEGKVTVRSGRSRFTVQTLPAEDFPTLSVEPGEGIELAAGQLLGLLNSVSFAMADKDIRHYLNAVLLKTRGDTVTAVATDGHRLAKAHVVAPGADLIEKSVLIPRKSVLELQRLVGPDEFVSLEVSDQYVTAVFGSVVLTSKLVSGQFPDYERVLPRDNDNIVTCSMGALTGAMNRVALMTGEKFNGIRVAVDGDVLRVETANSQAEEAVEEIDIEHQGGRVEIGVNVFLVTDMLANRAKQSESVQIALKDSKNAMLMTVPDDPSFMYVVMPMRI